MFLLFLTYRNLKLMGALLKNFTEPTPMLGIQRDSKVFMFLCITMSQIQGMEFEKIIFRGSTLYLKKNLHKAKLIWSEELIT